MSTKRKSLLARGKELLKSLESSGPPPECTDVKAAMKDRRKTIDALRNLTKTRYVCGIPRKPLPEGTVLVHNQVVPQRTLRLNGFRAWTQVLDDDLEVCRCKWAGVDLRGLVHYRVKRAWRA